MRFIRSWMETPLTTGAVVPSGKRLARALARRVDPNAPGPVIELGPGTGVVTAALVEHGIEPNRMVLVEFNPAFCTLLRSRYPKAAVVQGDAYRLNGLIGGLMCQPAAAIVSALPLLNKPVKFRLRLLGEALRLLAPGAPFVQVTYGMAPPIPANSHAHGQAYDRIWLNVPPAKVWVYRKP